MKHSSFILPLAGAILLTFISVANTPRAVAQTPGPAVPSQATQKTPVMQSGSKKSAQKKGAKQKATTKVTKTSRKVTAKSGVKSSSRVILAKHSLKHGSAAKQSVGKKSRNTSRLHARQSVKKHASTTKKTTTS